MNPYERIFVREPRQEYPDHFAAGSGLVEDQPRFHDVEYWLLTVKLSPPGGNEYLWGQVAINPSMLEGCVGGSEVAWKIAIGQIVESTCVELVRKYNGGGDAK